MKKKMFAALAFAAVALATASTAARANLVWNWSFSGGSEAGHFETNGSAADLAGPFNFTINPTTVTMTSSAFAPGLVGAVFNEGSQPGTGFLWNGSTATQFYRAGGALTNGTNFFSGTYSLLFGIFGQPIGRLTNNANGSNTGFQTLILTAQVTPPDAGNLPAPATLWLAAPALFALAAYRRRRAAR